jgi:hypothetical protein
MSNACVQRRPRTASQATTSSLRRGLRCNALLGDAHDHIHYEGVGPPPVWHFLRRRLPAPPHPSRPASPAFAPLSPHIAAVGCLRPLPLLAPGLAPFASARRSMRNLRLLARSAFAAYGAVHPPRQRDHAPPVLLVSHGGTSARHGLPPLAAAAGFESRMHVDRRRVKPSAWCRHSTCE